MENASKALLIAGGVLITVLVLSLLVLAKSEISNYYNSQEKLADIEDTAKFNMQFTNYDRDGVTGVEIISLINKVYDYNNRKTEKTTTNDSQAEPIIIYINIPSNLRSVFSFDGTTNLLISKDQYVIDDSEYSNNKKYNFKDKILDEVNDAIQEVGKQEDIERIAKDIVGIFKTPSTNMEKEAAKNKYNSYISTKDIEGKKITEWDDLIPEKRDAVYKYYEYVQFRKGLFNCDYVHYNKATGRVEKMSFTFDKIQ